jgi:hypothetical protein
MTDSSRSDLEAHVDAAAALLALPSRRPIVPEWSSTWA